MDDYLKLDQNILLCPMCSGQSLHHGTVTLFSREEDAEDCRMISIDDKYVFMHEENSMDSRNPSLRRGGITIDMICENCPFDGELCISQHKGSTLLEWREERA